MNNCKQTPRIKVENKVVHHGNIVDPILGRRTLCGINTSVVMSESTKEEVTCRSCRVLAKWARTGESTNA